MSQIKWKLRKIQRTYRRCFLLNSLRIIIHKPFYCFVTMTWGMRQERFASHELKIQIGISRREIFKLALFVCHTQNKTQISLFKARITKLYMGISFYWQPESNNGSQFFTGSVHWVGQNFRRCDWNTGSLTSIQNKPILYFECIIFKLHSHWEVS